MYKYKKILLSTALALSSMPLFAADYYVVLPSSSSAKPALDLKVSLSLAALPPGDVGRTYVFDFNEALMVTGDSQFDSQAVQWSISPELPEGLFFEGGVLSGAPTLTSQPVNYTISASYKGVSANQTYALAVDGPKGEKLANGVTVRCTGMADGEQFELDGKRYRVVYSKADAKAYAAEACTTNMTDMSMMMFGASFNENISHWDTANVISMYYMFGGANAFDQPIGY
jgi:surface protein